MCVHVCRGSEEGKEILDGQEESCSVLWPRCHPLTASELDINDVVRLL